MSKSPLQKNVHPGFLLTHLKSVTDLEPRFIIICLPRYSRPFTTCLLKKLITSVALLTVAMQILQLIVQVPALVVCSH